jgi:arabinofuranan 3-O-arabinosyltransferase
LTVTDVVGLTVVESLAVARDMRTDASRDTWVLTRSPGRGSCMQIGTRWSCSPTLARPGEDGPTWRRTLAVSRGDEVTVRATVRPVPGPALNQVLDRALGFAATATSTFADHPAARPGAAFDGDAATAWVADARDATPALTLTTPREATLTRVSLRTDARTRKALRSLVISSAGHRRTLAVQKRRNTWSFPALTGRAFRLAFVRKARAQSTPLRIEDLQLPDLPPPRSAAPVSTPCAVGPEVRVGGQVMRFAVRTTTARLVSGAGVPAVACRSGLELPSGDPQVEARSSATLAFDQLTIGRPMAATVPRDIVRVGTGSEHRSITVGRGPAALLVLDHGSNAGWRATADGRPLRAVTADGWRQGWLLPAGGETTVQLEFGPGRWHRVGLAIGALALLLLLGLTATAGRGRPQTEIGVSLRAAPGRAGARVALLALLGAALGGAVGIVTAAVVAAIRPRRAIILAVIGLSLAAAVLCALRSDSISGGRWASFFALLALFALLSRERSGAPVGRDRLAEPVEQPTLDEQPRQPAG